MIAKSQFRHLLGLESYESLRELVPFVRSNSGPGATRSSGDNNRYFTSREVGVWVDRILQILREEERLETGTSGRMTV